jgi:hypothetical protein
MRLERQARVLRAGWEEGVTAAAEAVSRGCLEGIRTREAWERRRPLVRQRLLWMLGLDPFPERTPLRPRVTGTLDQGSYAVEKVVFESMPGLLVTANLYLPRNRKGPVPCVLYLCGHQIHPLGAKTQYQERFLWYPAHGYACLAVDSLQCGEVQGLHHGTHTLGWWSWVSLGYTPAGVEVWNGMRALDYLAERPEVDPARIGVTGVSGGGVMTWYLAALDERVRAAAPSSSAYTVGSQARRRLVPFQCDCTFYLNVHRLDFPEAGALIAPRPLLILGGRGDRIFPPEGYRAVHQSVGRIYALYGLDRPKETGRIRLAECNDGHADSAESLREVRAWMGRWIGEAPGGGALTDDHCEPAPAGALACLARPETDAANFSIHRRFIPSAPAAVPDSPAAWQERRKAVEDFLRKTVFSWFPTGRAPYHTVRIGSSGGHARRFADYSEWEFDTEPGARVRVHLYQPRDATANAPLVLVVKGPFDTAVFPDDELLPLTPDHRILVLAPRFSPWSPGPARWAEIERTALLSGRSIAAMQVWDTLRALAWAREEQHLGPSAVSLFGRGPGAVSALYAGLLDGRVTRVVLDAPPASHWEGPPLPCVLRGTDVAEVAAALSPRELVLLSDPPESFHLTRAAYRLVGSPERCRTAGSLVQAVRGTAVTDMEVSCPASTPF